MVQMAGDARTPFMHELLTAEATSEDKYISTSVRVGCWLHTSRMHTEYIFTPYANIQHLERPEKK